MLESWRLRSLFSLDVKVQGNRAAVFNNRVLFGFCVSMHVVIGAHCCKLPAHTHMLDMSFNVSTVAESDVHEGCSLTLQTCEYSKPLRRNRLQNYNNAIAGLSHSALQRSTELVATGPSLEARKSEVERNAARQTTRCCHSQNVLYTTATRTA